MADQDVLEEIERIEATEKRRGRPPKTLQVPKVNPQSDGTFRKLWVKCVVDSKPWTKDQQLDHWKNYLIDEDDAVLLDARRFVVILEPPKG